MDPKMGTPPNSPARPSIMMSSNLPTAMYDAHPLHQERPLSVIIVGAGPSGLLLTYKLQRTFRNVIVMVLEKNDDVGGVWLENKYPGCAAETPSHNYTYSFEPKLDFKSVYPTGEEVLGYFNDFSRKYGLRDFCKFRHQVLLARWIKDEFQWLVAAGRTDSGEILHYRCDILINASGNLNRLKVPKIPGIKSFKGEVLHTAAWDDTVNLEGKTVGVIGNGASAAQLVVAIQPSVKALVNVVHQPVYVAMQIPEPRPFTAEELHNFAECPGYLLEHRRKQERESNAVFDMFIRGSYRQAHLRSLVTGEMRERLEDNLDLADVAIPDYEYGARPVVYCDGYLEALNSPKACLKVADITSIVADGFFCHVQKVTHTQGAPPKVDPEAESTPNDFINLDVLIFATGFQTDFLPPFRIEGPAGRLSDLWKEEPTSYLGVGVANFPNYMTFLGPNSLTANGGSVLPVIEAQADYMLYWFNRFQTEQVLQFSPKPAAVTDFIAHKNKFMASTVFQSLNVSSWYKGNPPSHNVTALWPGSHLHYLECLRKPRADDWDVMYIGNRFEYLGSGFSQVEGEHSDADWSYYIRDHDFSMGFGGLGTSVRWDRERLVRSGTCVEGGLRGYKWIGGEEGTVFQRGSWLGAEDDSEGESVVGCGGPGP